MNLHSLLKRRADQGNPLRAGLIGAGKFGAMFLSQARRVAGLHVVAIADLNPARAREACARVGWSSEQLAARSAAEARKQGTTFVTDDAQGAIASEHIEVMIDATGSPSAGISHALACFEHGKHIVMVNVEADALAGPLLARRAASAGVVYSLAYGDQPALICELVDWARTAGFEVVAAGKGTKYLPAYHQSTPDTVWGHYGFTADMVAKGDFNAQMFNSFLDGTKSAIEMTAVANATGLTPAPEGLGFPPCGADELAQVLKPRADGGVLHHRGQVEVISSLERDGSPVERDLRWGVYVSFAGDSEYVRRCFKEYGLVTDDTGNYTAMYKPYHLIGLELGISVASVGLRHESTGCATGYRADAVAVTKKRLSQGERLDGEGGYTVYGRLMPASDSLARRALPIGLAHGVSVRRDLPANSVVTWDDVSEMDSEAARFRRAMEDEMRAGSGAQALRSAA